MHLVSSPFRKRDRLRIYWRLPAQGHVNSLLSLAPVAEQRSRGTRSGCFVAARVPHQPSFVNLAWRSLISDACDTTPARLVEHYFSGIVALDRTRQAASFNSVVELSCRKCVAALGDHLFASIFCKKDINRVIYAVWIYFHFLRLSRSRGAQASTSRRWSMSGGPGQEQNC